MNQMQPDICNVSPMAPASVIEHSTLYNRDRTISLNLAQKPESNTLSLHSKSEYYNVMVQFSTIVHMSGVRQYQATAWNMAALLYMESIILPDISIIWTLHTVH